MCIRDRNSMDTKTEDCCEICLMPVGKEKGIFYEEWTEIDMIAPHDAPVNKDMPTPEQKERGDVYKRQGEGCAIVAVLDG